MTVRDCEGRRLFVGPRGEVETQLVDIEPFVVEIRRPGPSGRVRVPVPFRGVRLPRHRRTPCRWTAAGQRCSRISGPATTSASWTRRSRPPSTCP